MVISGKKTVKLFGYEDFYKMKPYKLGVQGRSLQSGVDLTDKGEYDSIAATCWNGELGAGDALFIPAFYWHQVCSDAETVSMNVFFGGITRNCLRSFQQKYC